MFRISKLCSTGAVVVGDPGWQTWLDIFGCVAKRSKEVLTITRSVPRGKNIRQVKRFLVSEKNLASFPFGANYYQQLFTTFLQFPAYKVIIGLAA